MEIGIVHRVRSKLPFTDVSLLNNTQLSAVDTSFDPEKWFHYTAFKAAGNPEFSRTTNLESKLKFLSHSPFWESQAVLCP